MEGGHSQGHAARSRGVLTILPNSLAIFLVFQTSANLLAASMPAPEHVQPTDSPATVAADRLAWDFGSWRAIELRMRHEFSNHEAKPEDKQVFNSEDIHYIELKDGHRLYDIRYMMDDSLFRRETHFCNGKMSALLNYVGGNENKQKSAILNKRAFWNEDRSDHVDRPIPILFNYVGRAPLCEALAKARYLGRQRVGERECDTFLFSGVNFVTVQDQVFHLDATSHIPIRVSSYRDTASREKDEPLWVWTADKLETVQGHIIPAKSTQISYSPERKLRVARSYTVQTIKFDGDYPAKIFWPELQPGVSVMDMEGKKSYKTPGKQPDSPQDRPKASPPGQAIIASPPGDWTRMVSWSMLGIGLAVVAAGGFMWYRRRS